MLIATTDALLNGAAFGPGTDTVLALNGWSAAWQAWQPTFELLAGSMRCISHDTRGTGLSTGSPDTISLDRLVADAVAVLDAYGVERCVVAGESLGSFIAMHLAARHPQRVSALVLVAAPAAVTPDRTAALVAGARADYRTTIRRFVVACLNEPGSERLLDWALGLFDQADPEVAARLFECCYGSVPDLSAICVPITLIHGAIDAVVPIESSRFLAAAIPGSHLIELDGIGHAPTVTAAGVVADAILTAVERVRDLQPGGPSSSSGGG